MDILLMVVYVSILLGFLVFIHEGGHFLAARAFGVRVTEFMLGFPGPGLSFKRGGTRFGVTVVPLGGYAKVCGMGVGEMSPHLEQALAALYRRGTATMEEIARDLGISDDEAYEALEQLAEWGSVEGPTKADKHNTYRAPEVLPTKKQLKELAGPDACSPAGFLPTGFYGLGEAREVDDPHALFESEYRQQYRAQPFWKRSIILLAGVATNLLFTIVAIIIIYSVIGVDMQYVDTGEIVHITLTPWESIQAGLAYIGMVVQAIAQLFNPATAAATMEQSASVMGIAIMSKAAAEAGLMTFFEFTAMISVSLGIMNLLPIPPLDGGRFVIEVFQKLTGKGVTQRAMNIMSLVGIALFLVFFLVMLNQDIQRFVFGIW